MHVYSCAYKTSPNRDKESVQRTWTRSNWIADLLLELIYQRATRTYKHIGLIPPEIRSFDSPEVLDAANTTCLSYFNDIRVIEGSTAFVPSIDAVRFIAVEAGEAGAHDVDAFPRRSLDVRQIETRIQRNRWFAPERTIFRETERRTKASNYVSNIQKDTPIISGMI